MLYRQVCDVTLKLATYSKIDKNLLLLGRNNICFREFVIEKIQICHSSNKFLGETRVYST